MYVRTTNGLWYRSTSDIRGLCARVDTLSSTGAQELGWMALYVTVSYFLPPLPPLPLSRTSRGTYSRMTG